MTEALPRIKVEGAPGRVTVDVEGGRWEGTPPEAERLLTELQYALARARPGTNIGSMFVNGHLWGGKFFEEDQREAIREMRHLVDDLAQRLDAMAREDASPQ